MQTGADTLTILTVDIGVFAHNEAGGIAAALATLARQTIWQDETIDVRLIVLANGCSDDTAGRARKAVADLTQAARFDVADLTEPGKSRTWNRFVHDLSRPEADVLICCDADIDIPDDGTLGRMLIELRARPGLVAVNSRPVKDIVFRPARLSPVERMIAAAGGSLYDWRRSICGQLYAVRSGAARRFHLPVGLPVEDGFVRAMLLTEVFSKPEDVTLIDGREDIFHIYRSERRIPALIRHQTRLVIGGAVNAVIFRHLTGLPAGTKSSALAGAADDTGWLSRLLKSGLPKWPYLWVPGHFLIKRLTNLGNLPKGKGRMRGILVLCVGLVFDLIVYVAAQIRMARGVGAGFW